jgi:hypothetical protein
MAPIRNGNATWMPGIVGRQVIPTASYGLPLSKQPSDRQSAARQHGGAAHPPGEVLCLASLDARRIGDWVSTISTNSARNWQLAGTRNNGQPASGHMSEVHGHVQSSHQRDGQRALSHVKPGDGPSDDHALDLRRALENREAHGGMSSFRR